MAFERQWATVAPQAFVANGSQFGLITLADTAGFKVKQCAYLVATGQPTLPVQIKRVLSPTQLIVGTINNAQIGQWPPLNISAYTLANNATIGAEMQSKSNIKPDDIEVATYEADPTVAVRVVEVDQYGNFYTPTNPLPVTPFSQFFNAITLGALGISTMIAECTKGIDYDEVDSVTVGNVETLTFLLAGVPVDQIEITYGIASWTFKCLGTPIPGDFLIYEDGDHILLEDGSGIYLLE